MIFGRFDDRIHAVHTAVHAAVNPALPPKENGAQDKERQLREQIPATPTGS